MMIMTSWRALYPTGVTESLTAPVPATSTIDIISLRTEFNSLLQGSSGEVPIGQTFILRRMRRNSDGALVQCICMDETYKEPDIDFPCSQCGGRGYLWDEELISGYKQVAAATSGSNAQVNMNKSTIGSLYVPAIKFYFKSDCAINKDDLIVEVDLDEEGIVITPYSRTAYYEVNLVRAMRADNGRIEFWVCDTQRIAPKTKGFLV